MLLNVNLYIVHCSDLNILLI